MCGGGGPPPPSATEEALRQKQLDLLNEQERLTKIFNPIQATELGYKPLYGTDPARQAAYDAWHPLEDKVIAMDKGLIPRDQSVIDTYNANRNKYVREWANSDRGLNVVTGYEKTPERIEQEKQLAEINRLQMDTSKKASKALNDYLDSLETPEAKAAIKKQKDIEAQQAEIAMKQGERQKLALEGKLPVSQGTADREMQEFQLLKERMARSGNPIIGDRPEEAYSLTTSGAQSLDMFKKRYDLVKDQERRGELDSGTSLYLQSVGLSGDIGNRGLATTQGLSAPGSFASTNPALTRGNPFAGQNYDLINGYGGMLQPYMQDRAMQYQSGLDRSNYFANERAGYMNLGGVVTGTALGAYTKSSREYKKKIVPLSKKQERSAIKSLTNAKLYKWQYKDEPDKSKGHLGVMAEEAPADVVSDDGKHIDIASYLGLLTASVKEMDRRLKKKGA